MPDEKSAIPISSLIDIVFLLIMFFVATAKIDQQGLEQNVKLVQVENMLQQEKLSPYRFNISVSQSGEIYLENQESDLNQLSSQLNSHRKRFGNRSEILLRADKHCFLSELEKVIEAITKSGLTNIKIISQLEK